MNQSAPREILKSILQGNAPERPLVVPIVFALGAKIENLPLSAYLENPTKITNALRQIRGRFRTDGVSSYFDPLLEVDAFGFSIRAEGNHVRTSFWPEPTAPGKLPAGLRTAEAAAASPRVKLAGDVIRRLKSLVQEDALLMAGVSGPVTLAKRLTQVAPNEIFPDDESLDIWPALDLAGDGIMRIASALVEAGANVIFIREDFLPVISPALWGKLQSLLGPVFNVIRFYEALPILQLPGGPQIDANARTILDEPCEAVLCSPSVEFAAKAARHDGPLSLGLSLPAELLESDDASREAFQLPERVKPVLLTTDGDVPVTTDLKGLLAAFDAVRRGL